MTFLSSDRPEDILQLVKAYPEFMECYQDIVEFRRKPEELMSMYTDAFIEAERNTVKYMCEEQQKEIKESKKIIAAQNAQLSEQSAQLIGKDETIAQIGAQLTEKSAQLTEQKEQLTKKDKEIAELKKLIQQLQSK